MIKKLGISVILMLECFGLLIYFLRMSHDPSGVYWHQYGWTILYDASIMLPLALLSLLFAFSEQKERCIFDKYFLIIIGMLTFTINIAVIAQYYNLIAHTYGLQISIVGIIVATFMISLSAYRHGYYSKN